MSAAIPNVPLSWGELIDKITILEIKHARMTGDALANVRTELSLLQAIAQPVLEGPVLALAARLRDVNETLWDIEDRIRAREAEKSFGEEFIQLARRVYHTNDERAAVKRQINLELKSGLIEEKSYQAYG